VRFSQRHRKGDLAVAIDVFNRAVNLTCLGRLGDAERDLPFCLRVFHEHQQPLYESTVVSELATVSSRRGDPARAAQFEAQSLDIRHRIDPLSDAAISHNNLAGYDAKLSVVGQDGILSYG
jgi:hypothetical protein